MMRLLVTIGLILAFMSGCSQSRGSLDFYNAAGEPVASARLELPAELPGVEETFEGTCVLLWASEAFPSEGMQDGRYRAYVYEQEIAFELNPSWSDNNVYFHGQFDGPELRGHWGYATFAGGDDQGRVLLRR